MKCSIKILTMCFLLNAFHLTVAMNDKGSSFPSSSSQSSTMPKSLRESILRALNSISIAELAKVVAKVREFEATQNPHTLLQPHFSSSQVTQQMTSSSSSSTFGAILSNRNDQAFARSDAGNSNTQLHRSFATLGAMMKSGTSSSSTSNCFEQ